MVNYLGRATGKTGFGVGSGGGGATIDATARALAMLDTAEAGESIPAGESRFAVGRSWLNATAGPITVPATVSIANMATAGFTDVTVATDRRTEIINRGNTTANVAPTLAEFASPNVNSRAIVNLNGTNQEFWSFATSAWVRTGTFTGGDATAYDVVSSAAAVTLTATDSGILAHSGLNDVVVTIPTGLGIGTERSISRVGANNVDVYVGDGTVEIIDGSPDGAIRINENGVVVIKKISATAWETIDATPSGGGGGGGSTPMTGANGTVAGTAGIVPAPAATDNNGLLRGNATWATPAQARTLLGLDAVPETLPIFIAGSVSNQTIRIPDIAHAFTINEVTTIATAGTGTVTVNIDGTPLGGTANAASTASQSQAHASANVAAAGATINVVISGATSLTGLSITINGTRPIV